MTTIRFAFALIFAIAPTALTSQTKPVFLSCKDTNNGFSLSLKIDGQNVFLNDELQPSIFRETRISFIVKEHPDFLHVLSRTDASLLVWNSKTQVLDSAYECIASDDLLF